MNWVHQEDRKGTKFTQFGDGILKMMTPTGLRRRSIRVPEAWGGKEHPRGRTSHSLTDLKEQFLCGEWWRRS